MRLGWREMLPGMCLLVAGCAGHPVEWPSAALDEDAFRTHVRTLASQEFQGRRPGTPGEERTVAYLTDQFRRLGLKPGFGKQYSQPVPLIEIRVSGPVGLQVETASGMFQLAPGRDVLIWSRRPDSSVGLEHSAVVFAGHGVVAPEYGWDDYAGMDVRGKTVLLLSNDPGFSSGDPTLFKGRAMTGYGTPAYKFEEAARHGAAGALIIHDDASAGYSWNAAEAIHSGPRLDQREADGGLARVPVEGWISPDAARRLLGAAGQDPARLRKAASVKGFKANLLKIRVDTRIHNEVREVDSNNLVAVIPGNERPHECIVFSAHWDGLGEQADAGGGKLFPGAIENASGVAALLTIAQTMSRAPRRPARSMVFLFPTATEEGLLGSSWYVRHPVCAMRDTVAVINVDPAHIGGPTRDVQVEQPGSSELDTILRGSALLQGREERAAPHPEYGEFFASDSFTFASAGVPVLSARGGIDDSARGPRWGQAQEDDFRQHRYLQPGDRYQESWDLRGTLQDLALYLDVAMRLAYASRFPEWSPNSRFRAIRERDRTGQGGVRFTRGAASGH